MLEQFGPNFDNRIHAVQEQCRVCGDPAAGFHFGVFTCEGCKSFFGRAHQKKLLTECKNKGKCEVNRNTRTKCKLCRLQKCLSVGMSKEASRYGRRSTYFKVHCMAEKQAKQKVKAEPVYIESDSSGTGSSYSSSLSTTPAYANAKLVQYPAEKTPPSNGSPFPARPVPCYPTPGSYSFNPLLYITPAHLQQYFPFGVSSVDRKLLSYGSPDVGDACDGEPQSAPLDLSQKSSRCHDESGGVVNQQSFVTLDNGRSVIKINNDSKSFDFLRHHSASTFQGFVN